MSGLSGWYQKYKAEEERKKRILEGLEDEEEYEDEEEWEYEDEEEPEGNTIEKPEEKKVEKAEEKKAEKPDEKQSEKAVEKEAEKSEEKKAEKAAEKKLTKPEQSKVEKEEKSKETPVKKVEEKSKETPVKKVEEKSKETPVKKVEETPVKKVDEKLKETSVKEVKEKQKETPIKKVEEKADKKVENAPVKKIEDKKIETPIKTVDDKKVEKAKDVQVKKVEDSKAKETPTKKVEESKKPEEKKVEKSKSLAAKKIDEVQIKKAENKPVKKAEDKPVKKAEDKPVKKAEDKTVKKVEDKAFAKNEINVPKKDEVKCATPAKKIEDNSASKPIKKTESIPVKADEKLAKKVDEKLVGEKKLLKNEDDKIDDEENEDEEWEEEEEEKAENMLDENKLDDIKDENNNSDEELEAEEVEEKNKEKPKPRKLKIITDLQDPSGIADDDLDDNLDDDAVNMLIGENPECFDEDLFSPAPTPISATFQNMPFYLDHVANMQEQFKNIPTPPIEKSLCDILKEERIAPTKRYARRVRENQVILPNIIPFEQRPARETQKGMGAFGRHRDTSCKIDHGKTELVQGKLQSETINPLFIAGCANNASQKGMSFGRKRDVASNKVIDSHKYKSEGLRRLSEAIISKFAKGLIVDTRQSQPFSSNRSQITPITLLPGMSESCVKESESFISKFGQPSLEKAGSGVIDRRRNIVLTVAGTNEPLLSPSRESESIIPILSDSTLNKLEGLPFGSFRAVFPKDDTIMSMDHERLCKSILPYQTRGLTGPSYD